MGGGRDACVDNKGKEQFNGPKDYLTFPTFIALHHLQYYHPFPTTWPSSPEQGQSLEFLKVTLIWQPTLALLGRASKMFSKVHKIVRGLETGH